MVKYAALASLVFAAVITQASAAAITEASIAATIQASTTATTQTAAPAQHTASKAIVNCGGKVIPQEDVFDSLLGIPDGEACTDRGGGSTFVVMDAGWTVTTTQSGELSEENIEICRKAFNQLIVKCIMGGDRSLKSPGLNMGEYIAPDGTLYKVERSVKV